MTKLDYEPQQPQPRKRVKRYVVVIVTKFVITWIVVTVIVVSQRRIDPAIGLCGAIAGGALLWFVLDRASRA